MVNPSSRTRASFSVDLRKIEGDGDFPCPKCKTLISPDDLTEEVYTILSIEGDADNPTRLTIQCNKCASIITIDGLSVE